MGSNIMAVIVVHWYSIVSVAIVGTAVVVSVYLLWRRKERRGAGDGRVVKRSLYESLLFATNNMHVVHDETNNNPDCESQGRRVGGSVCWSQQLWTSCWRGLHPGYLLGVRLLSFLVLAFFLSWDIQRWGASIFIYYTEWTYSLVMMYFVIGSVVSAHGCWLYHRHKDAYVENMDASQERSEMEENVVEKKGLYNKQPIKLQRQYYYPVQNSDLAGFWGNLMQIAYQISAGAVILTDVIFWCIIVPFISNARLGLNLLMICMHTVNIAFLLLDTSINRLPFPWFRLSYFVLWSSAYVIFQWLIHLCGFTWWPYPFLKLSTPSAPLWYSILAAFHLACYGLYALIVKVKDSLFSKLFPHSFLRSY